MFMKSTLTALLLTDASEVKKYSDDQPRDEQGRFGEGGAGSGGGSLRVGSGLLRPNLTESKLTLARVPASSDDKVTRMTTSNRTPMQPGSLMMSQGELFVVQSVKSSEFLQNYGKWQHSYNSRPATSAEVEARNQKIVARNTAAERAGN
jgi:hypothetical protein